MKIILYITALIVLVIAFSCKTQQITKQEIVGTNNSLLKYNKLYVFDNGIDTIHKNFSLFDSLVSTLPVNVDTLNPENNYITMLGSSTLILTLMFYNDTSGTLCMTNKRDWSTILERHQKKNSPEFSDLLIKDISINNNNITFRQGNRGDVESLYFGRIAQDTLFLTMQYSQNDIPIFLSDPTPYLNMVFIIRD